MDSGWLEASTTADLLRRYAAEGVTGCLRMERNGMQARVYFRDGWVYAATAPGARARLGDRLCGADLVSEEELAATLAHQRTLSEPRRIGELLIERGHIDRETMRTFVREQSTDSVAVTLAWRDGTWAFTPGEEVPEDVPLDMSVENLVMESGRRVEEYAVIRQRIGSTDAIVDFVARDDTAELALTPDEWSMLTRIDGQSSIAEIAEEAGYGEFEAARIIYGLLTAGIVTMVGEGRDPDPGEQSAEDEVPVPSPTAAPGAPYDPGEASALFGELGFDDPEAGRADADDAPAPPSTGGPAGREVNRNELLREFAALDGSEDEEPPPSRGPKAPSRRASDDDKDKRKGLFGRRRRD